MTGSLANSITKIELTVGWVRTSDGRKKMLVYKRVWKNFIMSLMV